MRDQPFDLTQIDRTDIAALKAAGRQLWYTFHLVMAHYPRMQSHDVHIQHLQAFMNEISAEERRFDRSLMHELFGHLCHRIEWRGDYWRVWPNDGVHDDELRKQAGFALGCIVVAVGDPDYILTPPRYGADSEAHHD